MAEKEIASESESESESESTDESESESESASSDAPFPGAAKPFEKKKAAKGDDKAKGNPLLMWAKKKA